MKAFEAYLDCVYFWKACLCPAFNKYNSTYISLQGLVIWFLRAINRSRS